MIQSLRLEVISRELVFSKSGTRTVPLALYVQGNSQLVLSAFYEVVSDCSLMTWGKHYINKSANVACRLLNTSIVQSISAPQQALSVFTTGSSQITMWDPEPCLQLFLKRKFITFPEKKLI